MNNPFQSPAFSMTALTAAINILPNQFGKIEQINLMPAKPVRFRQIAIEERDGVLNLLPTLPVGAPGTVGQRSRRKLRSFMIPHIPHDDVVLPEEIQGLRAFGSETDTETVANVMTDHLQSMRNKHAITLEHLRNSSNLHHIDDSCRLGTVVRRSKANVSGCRNRSLTFLVRSDSPLRRQLSVGICSLSGQLKRE